MNQKGQSSLQDDQKVSQNLKNNQQWFLSEQQIAHQNQQQQLQKQAQQQLTQQQFQQLQQQQTQCQQIQQSQQQYILASENLNFLQGGGWQSVQNIPVMTNHDQQISLSQFPTQPLIYQEEQRLPLNAQFSSSSYENNQNTGNYMSQTALSTLPNILSLNHIPTSIEKLENHVQSFSHANKLNSQSDPNILVQQQGMNHIYQPNNPVTVSSSNNSSNNNINLVNYNSLGNPVQSNNNNLSYGIPIQNQAVQNLSIVNQIQIPSNSSQLNFINPHSSSSINQNVTSSPFSQITPNFTYGNQKIQLQPNIPQQNSFSYGMFAISNSQQNQQNKAPSPINQQQQSHILSSSPVQQNQIQFIQNLPSNQHLQQQQNIQQNNQFFSMPINQASQTVQPSQQNIVSDNTKQISSASYQQLQSGLGGSTLPQAGYTSNMQKGNQFISHSLNSKKVMANDQDSPAESRKRKETLSTTSHPPTFQQKSQFPENIQREQQKGENQNKPSNLEKGVLQEHELQNSQKLMVIEKKQSPYIPPIRKIKEEEEEKHLSHSQSNNFINSEINQKQKLPPQSNNNNNNKKTQDQEHKIKKSQSGEEWSERKEDQSHFIKDIILEDVGQGNSLNQKEEDVLEKKSIENQPKFPESSGLFFNQKQKAAQRNKNLEDKSNVKINLIQKNDQIIEEDMQHFSISSGQNSKIREEQLQFFLSQRNSSSSQKIEDGQFFYKSKDQLQQKKGESINNNTNIHEFLGTGQTQVLDLSKNPYIRSQPYKRIKKSTPDETSGLNNMASYAFINQPENIHFQQDVPCQHIQKFVSPDLTKSSNQQQNQIFESKLQQGGLLLPPQIKIQNNQTFYDQSNLKSFIQKSDNQIGLERDLESGKLNNTQNLSHQPLPASFHYVSNAEGLNPYQYDLKNQLDSPSQQYIPLAGKNQTVLIMKNQSSKVASQADSQIEYTQNNSPINNNTLDKENISLFGKSNLGISVVAKNMGDSYCNYEENNKILQQDLNNSGQISQAQYQILGQTLPSTLMPSQLSTIQQQENNVKNNQIANSNNLLSPFNEDSLIQEFSIYNFLIGSVQKSFSIQQNMYNNLKLKQNIQDQFLQDTLSEIKSLRTEVDEMILHSTDIQGQSGLLDYMRGRLKEQSLNNPQLLINQDGNKLDPQKDFFSKYELILKEGDFSEHLVKDKNFIVGVSMQDIATKKEICNTHPIPVRLRLYTYNNPPNIFESDYIKGQLNSFILKGSCSFRKIHIKHVTSHQKNRAMFLVVEPDIEQIFKLPPLKTFSRNSSLIMSQQGSITLQNANECSSGNKIQYQSQQLEKQSQQMIKQESILSEKDDDNIQTQLPFQKQASLQISNISPLNSEKQQNQPYTGSYNAAQISPMKYKRTNSRKKKENDKKLQANQKQDKNEIVEFKINPILIKPLILEQIIVKSKNNIITKS